jgi:hypothetical protein
LIGMARFLRSGADGVSDRVQRAVVLRREVDRLCRDVEILLTRLRREAHGSHSSERAGKLGEDPKVGVQPSLVDVPRDVR